MKYPFPAHYFAQDAMGGVQATSPRLVYTSSLTRDPGATEGVTGGAAAKLRIERYPSTLLGPGLSSDAASQSTASANGLQPCVRRSPALVRSGPEPPHPPPGHPRGWNGQEGGQGQVPRP
jgi:hypothetical protein